MNLNRPDFKILDSLRGMAALYVVINHSRGHLFAGGQRYLEFVSHQNRPVSFVEKLGLGLFQLTGLGTEFVILFFILSGFSIAHSLMGGESILRFYQRRLIRIYPPYVMAIFYALLVHIALKKFSPEWFAQNGPLGGSDSFGSSSNIFMALAYVPSGYLIAQFWSLPHEILFYLSAPFIIRYKRVYYALSAVLYIFSIVIGGNAIFQYQSIIPRFLVSCNIFFAIGVFLYQHHRRITAWIARFSTRVSIAALVVFFVLLSALKYQQGATTNLTAGAAVLFSLIIFSVFIEKKINIPWLQNIGTYSYTLYITHLATIYLIKLVFKLALGWEYGRVIQWWAWLLSIPICLLFAYVFFLCAEKPTKLLLDRLRDRNMSTRAT